MKMGYSFKNPHALAWRSSRAGVIGIVIDSRISRVRIYENSSHPQNSSTFSGSHAVLAYTNDLSYLIMNMMNARVTHRCSSV